GGSIVDLNGGNLNVTANDLVATAAGSIELDTDVPTLAASSANGNITIRQDGDLDIGNVSAPLGTVTITIANGFLDGGLITALNAVLSASDGIDVTTTLGSLT